MKKGSILVLVLAAASGLALVWNGAADEPTKRPTRAFADAPLPAEEPAEGPAFGGELPPGHPPIDGAGVAPDAQLPPGHPPIGAAASAIPDVGRVEPLAGGTTIAQIVRDARKISGQRVRLAATILKSTPNVLGKTWLRVKDSSFDPGAGDRDLVVTTQGTPAVGDVVEIEGVVVTDKDLGSGYRYDVLIEDASVRAREKAR
jgi:hypothetical protein